MGSDANRMIMCRQCETGSAAGAQFCSSCGSALSATGPGVRKLVTVLFADITGSTTLGERLDPEALRALMLRYFDAMAEILEQHEATVEKFVGDAVMAVFGVPRVHEDDALRGVRAAVQMRDRLEQLNSELNVAYGVRLQVRTGINSGEVVTGDEGEATLVSGDAVNLAARLEQAADPGQILLGERTRELVSDAITAERVGPFGVKGKSEPIVAWRLIEVFASPYGHVRRFDTPFVGRGQEVQLLEWVFQRAMRERSCHLLTLLGPAGVGKSRLATEMLKDWRTSATVLSGRCLAYGDGITFWPVSEIVRQACAINERDSIGVVEQKLRRVIGSGDAVAERVVDGVAALLGSMDPDTVGVDVTWAFRKVLEILAKRRPMVVLFDDLHWAEPTLLDLVEHIAEWSRDVPLLLVGIARPELLDQRPTWGGGKVNSTSLMLEPLRPSDARALVDGLLAAPVAVDVAEHVAAVAGGNPLFVQELLRELVDAGLLHREGGVWTQTGDLQQANMPVTVSALLTARLDRLPAAERVVLSCAAVIGEKFERQAVTALMGASEAAAVANRLRALVRAEVLRAADPAPALVVTSDDEVFAFRHALIRDSTYATVPKTTRAALHVRFADFLESEAAGRNVELDELIGYHLEQAVRLRRDLGASGEPERLLAERAGLALATGGRRALAREDMPAAAKLLGRAVALLPAHAPGREDLLLHVGAALMRTGEFERALAMFDEAVSVAEATASSRSRQQGGEAEPSLLASVSSIRLMRLFVQRWLPPSPEPRAWTVEAERESGLALAVFAELGDERGMARAEAVLAQACLLRGQIRDREAALRRSLAHAERAGDADLATQALGGLLSAAVEGPLPVVEAIDRCECILQHHEGNRTLEARALRALAILQAMLRKLDDARCRLEASAARFSDLAYPYWLATIDHDRGRLALLEGNQQDAELALRSSLRRFRALGEGPYLSVVAAELGAAVAAEKLDEAGNLIELAERTAVLDDLEAQVRWRIAASAVRLQQRDALAAYQLAERAVALCEGSDALLLQADALKALETAARMHGRVQEARAAQQLREELLRRKGVLPCA